MKFGKKFKGQILKTFSVAALAVSVAAPNGVSAFTYTPTSNLSYREVSDKVDTITDKYAPTYYKTSNYSESDPLYAATRFHIFASDDVQINAHTNGNIAANHMSIAGSNSGTSGLPTELLISEVSYIKDFTGINSQILCNGNSPLVIGPDVVVDTYDNGNGFTVKGSTMEYAVQMNNSSVKNIFQETEGGATFIDMDAEFAKLMKLSKGLAEAEPTDDSSIIDFTDWNSRKINVDMSKPYTMLSVNAYDLAGNTPITITGYDETGSNSVIINVDLKDYSGGTFDEGAHIKYNTVSGEQIGNKERTTWEYGKVLWNFYDSSESDGCYKGKININGNFLGSILAPCANVETNQNFDGTAVCATFTNHAETHRNDFLGNMPLLLDDIDDTTASTVSTTDTTAETTTETSTATVTETTTKNSTSTEATTVAAESTTVTTKATETTTEATTSTNTTEVTTRKHGGNGNDDDDKTTSTTEESSTETTTDAAETTTNGSGDDDDDKTTTETSTETTTGAIEQTTKEDISDSSTETTSTEDFGSSSTESTTEHTEESETSTEDDTSESTTEDEEDSTYEDTTNEDITTSGQVTTDVTTSESTTESTTETTETTTEAAAETTTKSGHGSDNDSEDKTSGSTETSTVISTEESTEVTTDTSTETTTKGSGSSSSTGEDKDNNNNSSGGGSGTGDNNTEDTTAEDESVTETVTETTTKDGDSSSNDSGSSRRSGGGSSSNKATVAKDDDPESTTAVSEEEIEAVTDTDVDVSDADKTNDTDTEDVATDTNATDASEAVTTATDTATETATVSSDEVTYTVSVTDAQDTTQAVDGVTLPQTGSVINTKALFGAGCGIICLGIFLVLKSKRKAA